MHLTILPVEDAPIAVDDHYSVNEDGLLPTTSGGVLLNDYDADGDVMQVTLLTGPTHGTLELDEDGSFTYRPNADFHGDDSFTYLAGDGTYESNLATVQITVESVNDAPRVIDWAYEIDEDSQLDVDSGGLLTGATDVEGDQLSALMVDGAQHGQVTVNPDGSFRYTPHRDFSGVDTFTYRAQDGVDDSNVATVQVTVNNINDKPYGNDNVYISIENQTLRVLNQGVLSDDFDSDGDTLTAELITGPEHGELTLSEDGTFLYAPDGGFFGVDTFTYVANDGTSDSEVITVTLRVIPQLPPTTVAGPPTTETRADT